jgi:hypothetical protein
VSNNDLIELAESAGWGQGKPSDDCMCCSPFNITLFASLVAAKEREACAVIAETPISGEQDDITMEAKDRVAKAIRARGEA